MPRKAKMFMKVTPPATKFIKTFSCPGPSQSFCITVKTPLENALIPRDQDITLVQLQKQATELGYELRRNMATLIHDRSVNPKTLAYWDPRIWLGKDRCLYVCVFADVLHLDETLATLKKLGYEKTK